MSEMKCRVMTGVVIAVLSLALGSIGFLVAGCKTQANQQPTINVIDNQTVVTNVVPVKQFNDEHYVWESFYFSTNKASK